jgi:hypothetical protein
MNGHQDGDYCRVVSELVDGSECVDPSDKRPLTYEFAAGVEAGITAMRGREAELTRQLNELKLEYATYKETVTNDVIMAARVELAEARTDAESAEAALEEARAEN